jgi:hypothetical protein
MFTQYTYVMEDHRASNYWDRSLEGDMHSVPELSMSSTDDEPGLWYPVQQEQLNTFEYSSSSGGDSTSRPQHSMVGHWGGKYMVGSGSRVIYLDITSVEDDGQLSGAGADIYGRFKIDGKIDGDQAAFVKEYLQPWKGEITKWACEATLNGDTDRMEGVWRAVEDHDRLPPTESSADPTQDKSYDKMDTSAYNNGLAEPVTTDYLEAATTPHLDNSGHETGDLPDTSVDRPVISLDVAGTKQDVPNASTETGDDTSDPADDTDTKSVAETEIISGGTFELLRRPVEWFLCRPSAQEFERNRLESLWKFALIAVSRRVQTRSPHWAYMQTRRRLRQRYMELRRHGDDEGEWSALETHDWIEIVKIVHAEDRVLWKAVMEFEDRRDVVHPYAALYLSIFNLTTTTETLTVMDAASPLDQAVSSASPAGKKQRP